MSHPKNSPDSSSPISRRDFINGSTAIVGAALAGCGSSENEDAPELGSGPADDYSFDVGEEWYGPGGDGDYRTSHGNTPDVLMSAHRIRAGAFDGPLDDAVDTGESYDLVIVGGGLSGLSAAHHFRRHRPRGRCLILDNHPVFGGEAKRNELVVDGRRIVAPQGSDDFGVLAETGEPDDYFTSLGIPREFAYGEPSGGASGMGIPLDHFSYLHWKTDAFSVGHFFDDAPRPASPMFPDLPRPQSHLLRAQPRTGWGSAPWENSRDPEAMKRWRDGAADTLRGDRELEPWLDSMTVKTYYESVLGLPESVTAYVDPILASIIGLGCDAISAWWGWHFELPGFRKTDRYRDLTFHCFPGGNTGFARYFVKNLNPDAIEGGASLSDVLTQPLRFDSLDKETQDVNLRMNATVVRVGNETDGGVSITYFSAGKLHRLRASAVVMASGGWANRRVIRDLPQSHHDAYGRFGHSAVLIANVALRNWRFLERLGVAACIYEGGFGFSCNISRPMRLDGTREEMSPDQPTMLTFYVPYFYPGLPMKRQGEMGRLELLTAPFSQIEQNIRAQMNHLFADSGFDDEADIAGIILNRWGHAYTNPGPGFMFGEDGATPVHEVIREPIGRIAIGHSELGGHQNWTGAAAEGRRAVETLLDSA